MYNKGIQSLKLVNSYHYLPAPFPMITTITTGYCELLKQTEHVWNLEYTDIIADPFLLVLSYTLSDPSNVPDFLIHVSVC